MKMHLRKERKKKIKFRYFIYLFIIYLSFSYTYYYSLKSKENISNEKFISFLLKEGNIDYFKMNYLPEFFNSSLNFFLKLDFSNPSSLLKGVFDYQKSSISLTHNDDYSNLEELKSISSYISDPNKVDINNPIIYLYNSHQLENYNNANLEIYGITPNVLMASYLLKEKLNNLGLSTIVEDTNESEFMTINGWDYNYSYTASRLFMLDKKSKYSSLKYYIDIHRDSVSYDLSTTTIGEKKYAKILFVLGLENPNYSVNLNMITKLNEIMNKNYPNLSRGILKKEGPNVDGVYNQDISGGAMLIEVGGVENNIMEVLNTIDAISVCLKEYINNNA